MLHEDQLIELLIEKPVAGGRMLARHAGQVVLVSGTIPGERVRARIERVGRGMAFAHTVDILEPAPDRRTPAGDPQCGGNIYAHVAYDSQPAIKREVLRDALRHGGRIDWSGDLPVAASPELSYRMRARLHVRNGRVGFFREGTHELCDARRTGQLLPAAIDAIEQLIEATPRPWLDAIDAIELAENMPGDQRALHVLWSQRIRPPRGLPPDTWNVASLPGLTGLSMDNPLSGRPRNVAGSPWVSDPMSRLCAVAASAPAAAVTPAPASAPEHADPPTDPALTTHREQQLPTQPEPELRRQASSFFQANRYLLPHLVATVVSHVGCGPIVDLYAGVGLFAMALAATGREGIVAIEGDPSSAHDLRLNAQAFGPRIVVEHSSVEQYLAEAPASDWAREATLIVDPPRTGMSREALTAIIGLRAARLLYVSCDVATLARDLHRLIESGYTLQHLEAFDLFPNTAHIESLAVLQR